MKRFMCSYEFAGDKWGVEIYADTIEEANRKLRAVGSTGKVDGEILGLQDMREKMAQLFPWMKPQP
jgi:hypothetical protein